MAFGNLEHGKSSQPMSDINVTPLVDVMLVLLVIFIITAPLMVSSLKLDLPKTEAAQQSDEQNFISISLDKRLNSASVQVSGFSRNNSSRHGRS